jgi:hypothetical protein
MMLGPDSCTSRWDDVPRLRKEKQAIFHYAIHLLMAVTKYPISVLPPALTMLPIR